jgi:tRNA U34 5-methylaminomethyl-2-thiouridine-forming methyltransferase MnmC
LNALLPAQHGADGSFSLYSPRFGEAFHGAIGALREARLKAVEPAQLERFAPGSQLLVVDVGFGLGTNSAALLEAASAGGLSLTILGLELEAAPLQTALAAEAFRRQWQPATVALLEQLLSGSSASTSATSNGKAGRHSVNLHWGDARLRLPELLGERQLAGGCDLVLLDAFSPQHCPELWSLEFLSRLARLLKPEGRLLTYCCAAAVRHSLRLAGLELASIQPPGQRPLQLAEGEGGGATWSYGTAASPSSLMAAAMDDSGPLRTLSAMELEHLHTRAAEPYRDPSGQATAAAIQAARQQAQASSSASSTSAWRRRWGLERSAPSIQELCLEKAT